MSKAAAKRVEQSRLGRDMVVNGRSNGKAPQGRANANYQQGNRRTWLSKQLASGGEGYRERKEGLTEERGKASQDRAQKRSPSKRERQAKGQIASEVSPHRTCPKF